jgi:hypothetical protein
LIVQFIEINGICVCVQKHFDRTHFSRNSTNSSWGLQNWFAYLSMQARAKSISCDQAFMLGYTRVFSLVMRIYRPMYIERVWRGSQGSCTSLFGILLLNLTRMNDCMPFNTTCPEKVPIFICALRSSFR